MQIIKEEDIDRWLRRQVIFYAKTEEWRNNMFDKVLAYYPQDMIEEVIKLRYGHSRIILKDGSSFRFVKANEGCRGLRSNFAFVEKSVSAELLDCVIRPKVIDYDRDGVVIVAEKRD